MTRHRDLEAELHPSVRAARDLRATADLWPALHRALEPGSTPQTGGKRTKRDAAPLPINAHVSDILAEIGAWASFWARVLQDESDWTPPMDGLLTTPRLLRELAGRVGHFTSHPDQMIGLAFVEECREMKRKAEATAYPSGARRVPTRMPCAEDTCPGEYRGIVPPDSRWTEIPDLVCTKDREHTITPEELMRIQRQQDRGRLSKEPAEVRDYLKRLRQRTPVANLMAAAAHPGQYANHVRAARRKSA